MTTGPLDGLEIVVTRPRAQAAPIAARLESLGATVHPIPVIRIVEPADGGAALADALDRVDRYEWIVITSMNGARAVLDEVERRFDQTAGAPYGTSQLPPIACVGPGTARLFVERGIAVDLVPDRNRGEGLVEAIPSPEGPGPHSVLLPQAAVARPTVAEGLAAKGWDVERLVAYRTVDAEVAPDAVERGRAADMIVFTSSSTVERWLRLVGRDGLAPTVASIGPVTTATAADLGVTVDISASVHTLDGLIDAIVDWAGDRINPPGIDP